MTASSQPWFPDQLPKRRVPSGKFLHFFGLVVIFFTMLFNWAIRTLNSMIIFDGSCTSEGQKAMCCPAVVMHRCGMMVLFKLLVEVNRYLADSQNMALKWLYRPCFYPQRGYCIFSSLCGYDIHAFVKAKWPPVILYLWFEGYIFRTKWYKKWSEGVCTGCTPKSK